MQNRWNARDLLTSTRRCLLAVPVFVSASLLTVVVGCSGNSDSEFTEFEAMAPELDGNRVSAVPEDNTANPPVSTEPPASEKAEGHPPEIEVPAVRTSDGAASSPPDTAVIGDLTSGVTPVAGTNDLPVTDQTAVTPSSIPATESPSETEPTAEVPITGTPAEGISAEQSSTLPTEPLEIKLLIPEKMFRPEKNSPALRVSYDDIDLLKVLNMEPVPVNAVEYFPEWLKGLDGATIRIRGFMYPTFEATGLTGFTLARDNGICCFVRQPKIYDIIAVELAPGVTSDYIEGKPFDVEGTFRIQPEADETALYRLFRIENARVLR
ncbi:MAG: hypothetical protein JNL58_24385 [Planctomyces sp.]|nr:hypothetical protein [Planctomyces sp.]